MNYHNIVEYVNRIDINPLFRKINPLTEDYLRSGGVSGNDCIDKLKLKELHAIYNSKIFWTKENNFILSYD